MKVDIGQENSDAIFIINFLISWWSFSIINRNQKHLIINQIKWLTWWNEKICCSFHLIWWNLFYLNGYQIHPFKLLLTIRIEIIINYLNHDDNDDDRLGFRWKQDLNCNLISWLIVIVSKYFSTQFIIRFVLIFVCLNEINVSDLICSWVLLIVILMGISCLQIKVNMGHDKWH